MNCDRVKLKNRCGLKTSARCVFYDLSLPEHSKLKILNECVTIEETTDDLYALTKHILEHLDTSALGKDCFSYQEGKSSYKDEKVVLIKDVLKKLEEEVCKLKNSANTTSGGGGNSFGKLDLKCLVDDPCDTALSDTDVIQLIIDKLCSLESEIKTLKLNNG